MITPLMSTILCAAIPSFVSGFGLYLISKTMTAHQTTQEKRESDRIEGETHVLKTLMDTAEATKAIATAIQRIPDAHCNGDMKAAIKKMDASIASQREFLRKQAVKATKE